VRATDTGLVSLLEAAGLASITASTQGLRYALARLALRQAEAGAEPGDSLV